MERGWKGMIGGVGSLLEDNILLPTNMTDMTPLKSL